MSQENLVRISILDKFYKIKCSEGEAQALEEAAHYIDQQMRKVRQKSPAIAADQLAVLVALNIHHELIHLKQQKNQSDQYVDTLNHKINDLSQRITERLASISVEV